MCRNIKTLFNFDPPATPDEVHAACEQFVRKISGTTRPSRANAEAFNRAINEVQTATTRLLERMKTSAPAKNRQAEAEKARARAKKRYRLD